MNDPDPTASADNPRWNNLSKALSEFHDRAWNSRRKVTWFAQALARSIMEYIGIPVGRDLAKAGSGIEPIKFYTYRAGSTAEWDEFELQESAFDAIGADVDGFYTFGLGIQLELGPTTTPRYRFNWGIRLNTNSPEWQFYSGAMGGERITFAEPKNYEDIQFLAEATYNGLLRFLTTKVELAPKIGFRFVSEAEESD